MKIYHFLILLVLLSLFLSSCGSTSYMNGHYASSEAGVLEISDKDDLKVTGSLSLSDIGNGFNAQVGYSPIKHVAITSSFARLTHNKLLKDENSIVDANNGLISTKFNLIEGSIGTYYLLQFIEEAKNLSILFDVYAGYGLGKVKNEYGYDANSNLNFNHYYLQGGAHLRIKWFGISYLVRQTKLDYTKGDINFVHSSSEYYQKLNDLQYAAPFTLTGKSLRMNFYGKPFQFYFAFSLQKIKDVQDNVTFSPVGSDSNSKHSLEIMNIGVTTEINDLIDFIKRNKNKKNKM